MIEMIGFELINNGINLGSGKGNTEIAEYSNQNKQKNYRNNNDLSQNEHVKGRYFRIMHFVKNSQQKVDKTKLRYEGENYGHDSLSMLSTLLLTECIYKKR